MIVICSRAVWRRLLLLMGVLLLFGLYITGARVIQVMAPVAKVTVMVDPGHGGVDSGCNGGNLQEKTVNLWLGLAVVEHLKHSGVSAGITRTGDYALEPFGRPGRHRRDLLRRVHQINNSRAKAYISIHCDWSHDKSRQGAAVFYCYRSAESKKLALSIQRQVNSLLGSEQKAEPGNYFILKTPAAPGALVEAGFLSNPKDVQRLKDPKYRSKLAAAIARGVINYLKDT